MRSLISLSLFDVAFVLDCKELTQLLDILDEWPAFTLEVEDFSALELSVTSFTLSFISQYNNTHADCLAKKARSYSSVFTHVSPFTPEGFFLERNRPFLT